MERCQQPLLLLWLVAMVLMNILGISHAGNPVVADNKLVGKLLLYSHLNPELRLFFP